MFKNINDMASVKRGRFLARIVLLVLPVVGSSTTCAKVRAIYVFLNKLHTLFHENGAKGACLILKVYAVTLQQSIGGHVVPDLTLLKFRVGRTNRGLPRVIPAVHRKMIRNGDVAMIRLYLTLFNLYRLIDFKGDMRVKSLVKTIISPAVHAKDYLTLRAQLLLYVPVFFKALVPIIGLNTRSLKRELMMAYSSIEAIPLLKSSPFTLSLNKFSGIESGVAQEQMVIKPVVSSHPIAIHEAANALENNAELHDATHFFLGLVDDNHVIRRAYRWCTQFPLKTEKGTQYVPTPVSAGPVLGKLALKEEAAGKVRVFAMVDVWTQWLLKPLHDTIFNHVLPGIDQDGTMDQMAPISKLITRDPNSLFSIDLSAATDRLPIWLQEAILAHWIGKEFAHNWATFLVARDYALTTLSPFPKHTTAQGDPLPCTIRVRYAVGQPMGALSSWAMLALTHHFVVQFAAYQVGHRAWFTDYALLGDDLVIGNAAVAKRYLHIMSTLGVGIGLHKSLLSPLGTTLEFAKRTFHLGIDVSPVPFTELKSAFSGPANAVQFIKKYNLSLTAFLKAAGYGYKVLGQLQKPLGKLNAKVRLVILALNIPFEKTDVEAFFNLGMAKAGRSLWETMEVINQLVDKEFKLLQRAVNAVRAQLGHLEGAHLYAKDIANELLPRLSKDIRVSEETQEMYDWAKAQVDTRSNLDHWIKGDGFVMSPVPLSALDIQFQAELEFADANPELVLRGIERLRDAELLKDLIPGIKTLQYMTQGHYKTVAQVQAASLKERLTAAMLSKYDVTASDLFWELISISKDMSLIPLANLKYARIIDAEHQRFTEGTYIRLWKSLSGLAQGTSKGSSPKPLEREFTGWW